MKKDIEDLKAVSDSMFLQLAEITAKLNTLNSMVLGVYKETLPDENYRTIYSNFVNVLEENMKIVYTGIEDILFDDRALFLKSKIAAFAHIQELKQNSSYDAKIAHSIG